MNNQNTSEKENKEQVDALKILSEKGDKAFIKHVFTDKHTGKSLTYAQMREKYG